MQRFAVVFIANIGVTEVYQYAVNRSFEVSVKVENASAEHPAGIKLGDSGIATDGKNVFFVDAPAWWAAHLTGIQHMSEAELDKLYQLIEKDFPNVIPDSKEPLTERPIGSMKGMLVYMADDFNEPLEDFADYTPDDKPVK